MFGLFNGIQQLVCIFLFSDNALFDQFLTVIFQNVNIRNIMNVAKAYQFCHINGTKALDIHGITSDKINDMPL